MELLPKEMHREIMQYLDFPSLNSYRRTHTFAENAFQHHRLFLVRSLMNTIIRHGTVTCFSRCCGATFSLGNHHVYTTSVGVSGKRRYTLKYTRHAEFYLGTYSIKSCDI